MKRCQNCGTENDHDGSFCRNCGTRLPVSPVIPPEASRPTAAAGETEGRPSPLPVGSRCPVCGTEAASDSNFCRSCGTDRRRGQPPPSMLETQQDPSRGAPVPSPWGPQAAAGSGPGGPSSAAPVRGYTPPAASPSPTSSSRDAGVGARAGAGDDSVACPRCRAQAPAGHMFCPSCGAQLPTVSGARTPSAVLMARAARDQDEAAVRSREIGLLPTADGNVKSPMVRASSGAAPVAAWGRLVTVNRDGSDGPAFDLRGSYVDVGSHATQVVVADDPYIAFRHLRVERNGEAVQVVPLDELNGVLLRLREPTELLSGAVVLLGRELCRLDLVTSPPGRTLEQHGVTLLASPPRHPWARLTHLLADGSVGDIRHFYSDEVVVGREEGDIVFADDEFMSRRHASFRRRGQRCILEDLDSSNGTFLRLDGPMLLSSGDFLRVGDHMFRFEG